MADAAFSDLKVLDLGSGVAGPYCAKLFADFGADVIKVEEPTGDTSRRAGPFPADKPHPEKSGAFLYLNTNKRGVTLDWWTPSGLELLKRLVAWADVVVENSAPGTLEGEGLGWEEMERVNPKLVLTSITPFGQTGPYRDYAADEIVLFAMSGRMAGHGLPDREPLRYAPDTAWFQVGATAAVATLGALFASRRFGIGQRVDVSALEALAGNVDTRSMFYTMTGQALPRATQRVPMTATTGVVACKDGFMLMIAQGERFFRRLLRAIDRPELAEDPRFSTLGARAQNRDDLDAIILPWMAERTKREVFDQLQAFSVMCSPVQTVDEVLLDPQVQARGFFTEIDHPRAGKFSYPGAPFLMSETPFEVRRRAPLLGEHNVEVYEEIAGLSKDDISILRASGVI